MSDPSPFSPTNPPPTVIRLGDGPAREAGQEPATVVRQPVDEGLSIELNPAAVSPAAPNPATVVRGSGSSAAAAGPAPGAKQFGDYELLHEVARGGMGVVYKARHTKLNRTVALKMILSGQLADESAVRRFYNEAESAARLHHPHIVAIHDVGQLQGQHYFSMEFVSGRSLAELISSQELTPQTGAVLVRAIAQAIHYAHGQGVLHRDLKPANVLVDAEGQPRVTDFGLAKQLEAGSDLTSTGMILGTPNYMSPEQAMARHDLVGPASDVYALGAMLFEILTGRPPFRGQNVAATILEVIHSEPPVPRALAPRTPRELETICLKCLAKDPRERYATAGELALDLDLYLRGEPINARPLGMVERVLRWARQRPLLAVIYGTGLTFYTFHLLAICFLRPQPNQWTFHWQITALLGAWIGAGTLFHPFLQQPRFRLAAAYGMMLASAVLATLGLCLDRGPASAPIYILLAVIPISPLLLPSARLIGLTTLTTMVCYTAMAAYAERYVPANAITGEEFAAFITAQLGMGIISYLWVRGVRAVDTDLPSSQATALDTGHQNQFVAQAAAEAKTVQQTPEQELRIKL